MVICSPEDFEKLSTNEKILLVQDMWDKIAEESDQIEVTEAQREELDNRLESHQASPNDVSTWDDVRHRIRNNR